jgi:hypothetical protein
LLTPHDRAERVITGRVDSGGEVVEQTGRDLVVLRDLREHSAKPVGCDPELVSVERDDPRGVEVAHGAFGERRHLRRLEVAGLWVVDDREGQVIGELVEDVASAVGGEVVGDEERVDLAGHVAERSFDDVRFVADHRDPDDGHAVRYPTRSGLSRSSASSAGDRRVT